MRFNAHMTLAAIVLAAVLLQMACAKSDVMQTSETAKPLVRFKSGVEIETAFVPAIGIGSTNIALAKYEVTEALWHEIMGGNVPDADHSALPKSGVSYSDVKVFLRKLNERPEVAGGNIAFRLPTCLELSLPLITAELKWRQIDDDKIDMGTPKALLNGGWFAENAGASRHHVGSAEADKFGIFDLFGNVWEMTSTEVSGDDSLIKCLGGSFRQKASRCTSSFEYWYGKDDREGDVGFRLVACDRAEYLAECEREDMEQALSRVATNIEICEMDMKYAKGVGRRIRNEELDALHKLQSELGKSGALSDAKEGSGKSESPAQKGDRLVVWKSEINGTEITFDGTSFAFRSSGASDIATNYRNVKTESVITIGAPQQMKVFFTRIGESWSEMIRGASNSMETSFPEVESAEWTYEDDVSGKAYGRKRFVELEARCEGSGDYGKAEQLTLATKMFKAKETAWFWVSEIYISEKDAFAIKEKHLLVDDLVRKYARLTGESQPASTSACLQEMHGEEEVSPLIAKLRSDMVSVPGRTFHVCKYEVTQALWEAIMGSNPSYFQGKDLPVDSVSWEDTQAFITRLNSLPEVKTAHIVFRLPTDDEWEYACRAGRNKDEEDFGEYAWVSDWKRQDDDSTTHSVGTKKPNAYGVYDMIGNVAEWTADDVVGKYFHNCRGGCFDDTFARYNMGKAYPYCYKGPNVGFRLAYDVR